MTLTKKKQGEEREIYWQGVRTRLDKNSSRIPELVGKFFGGSEPETWQRVRKEQRKKKSQAGVHYRVLTPGPL